MNGLRIRCCHYREAVSDWQRHSGGIPQSYETGRLKGRSGEIVFLCGQKVWFRKKSEVVFSGGYSKKQLTSLFYSCRMAFKSNVLIGKSSSGKDMPESLLNGGRQD